LRILVVDDEVQITRVLRAALQSNGYEVTTATNGVEALAQYLENTPDLVITDLSMPDMDGVELTREIRQRASTPIVIVSVRNQESAKIQALDEGADDYITKPFGIQELLARVRVQLRRTMDREPSPTHVKSGDFEIDAEKRIVKVRGVEVHLTPKEFDLLLLFARSPERVLTHRALLKGVWGPSGIDQSDNLRVLVGQLRRKIERDPTQPYIQTEPWVGYRFRPGE
jgi:two-component system, OmpR family, KDP operon response regulator KdpE